MIFRLGCLKKAKTYSDQRGVEIEYFHQDLREPFPEKMNGSFHVVSSLNNSLIFVSNQEESYKPLVKAFKNLNNVCLPEGFLLISLRPYDEYWEKQLSAPPGREPQFLKKGDVFVKFSQKYKWLNEKFYECTTSYDIKSDIKSEKCDHVEEKVQVRAWRQWEVEKALSESGWSLRDTFIYNEAETHYRERYFIAQKA